MPSGRVKLDLKMKKGAIIIAAFFLLAQSATYHTVSAKQYTSLDYSGNWCLSFDGNLSYVDLGASTLFRQSSLTIEAWVKPTYDIEVESNSTYGHEWGTIAHCDIMESWVGRYNGWWFGFDYTQGVLEFEFRTPSNMAYMVHANKPFWNSSSWYYVAVTFNSTLYNGNVVFYVDGVFDSQQDMSYTIDYYTPFAPMQIGGISDFTDATRRCAYSGLIDEVRLWNASRTQSQIQNAWNRTLDNNIETADPDLMAYLHFDDASGTHALDSSAHTATNMGILLPNTNLPTWTIPGAHITPEFSLLPAVLILVATSSLGVILLRRRLRKLSSASFIRM